MHADDEMKIIVASPEQSFGADTPAVPFNARAAPLYKIHSPQPLVSSSSMSEAITTVIANAKLLFTLRCSGVLCRLAAS
jgi:hypothetical protein